jgi:hypothetical protein
MRKCLRISRVRVKGSVNIPFGTQETRQIPVFLVLTASHVRPNILILISAMPMLSAPIRRIIDRALVNMKNSRIQGLSLCRYNHLGYISHRKVWGNGGLMAVLKLTSIHDFPAKLPIRRVSKASQVLLGPLVCHVCLNMPHG